MRVYPKAGDGLGLRAHRVERHGRSSKVQRRAGEEPRAHRWCRGRQDGGAVVGHGRVALVAVQCGVASTCLIGTSSSAPATPATSRGFGTLPSSSSPPSSLLARVCCGRPPRWRRGDGTSSRATRAGAFIAKAPSSNGGRHRAVEARAMHPTVARGCVGAAQGGARPCPGRDPLARSCQHCQPPVAWAVEAWVRRRRHCGSVRLTRGVRWQ